MRSKLMWLGVVISGLAHATPSIGNPILLSSYDQYVETGRASSNPITTPWAICFILQLSPPSEWEWPPRTRTLGEDMLWGEGQAGTIWYTSENTDQFSDFAFYATNGIEDDFIIYALDRDGGGKSLPQSEHEITSGTPDLYGYALEAVSLTVSSIHFEPYSPVPGLEGYRYEAQFNWSFYGTPIPEPNTLLLVLLPAVWAGCAAKRRIRS